MLGTHTDWPEGFERALRVSNALRLEVTYAEQNGVGGLVQFVSDTLLPEKPWLYFPNEDKPSPISDYFRTTTGLSLDAVLAMMRAYGRGDIAEQLTQAEAAHDSTAVRAGGSNNPDGANQHKGAEVNHNKIMNDLGSKARQGTGKAYTLRRLQRLGRTDLVNRVAAGELSANAAAIEAGIRKKPTPLESALKLIPKLTDDEWGELVAARAALDGD
jgi:hypothetical protein